MPRKPSVNDATVLAERPHERLRRMLDRAGLSNKEVAAGAKVAVETVSRWRSGAQAINDNDLFILLSMLEARGIHITPGWVRYGEGQLAAMPDPALDRKLTDEELARAARKAEIERRATAVPAGKKRRVGRKQE